jgi:hypothetical protein
MNLICSFLKLTCKCIYHAHVSRAQKVIEYHKNISIVLSNAQHFIEICFIVFDFCRFHHENVMFTFCSLSHRVCMNLACVCLLYMHHKQCSLVGRNFFCARKYFCFVKCLYYNIKWGKEIRYVSYEFRGIIVFIYSNIKLLTPNVLILDFLRINDCTVSKRGDQKFHCLYVNCFVVTTLKRPEF